MSFLKDSLAIFKKSELTFLEKHQETEGVYTFTFEKEKDLTWNPGQHGLFTITHRKVKNGTKPMTVASSPAEGVVRITTQVSETPSDFKKALLELEKGMSISMSGPVGSFYLKDESPALFIAAGIGITPFRAMIKHIEAEGKLTGKQIKLLCLECDIFKDELQKSSAIDATYLDSMEELHREINEFVSAHKDGTPYYYIAGSKKNVTAINSYLKDKNIPKRNVKKDVFI